MTTPGSNLPGKNGATASCHACAAVTCGLPICTNLLVRIDAALEPKYTAWIAQFPKSYVAHLARAIYYKKLGQESRGTDSIANTTDEQVRGMEAAFAKALSDLHASVKLDDKPLLTYLHELDINSYEGDAERDYRRRLPGGGTVASPASPTC